MYFTTRTEQSLILNAGISASVTDRLEARTLFGFEFCSLKGLPELVFCVHRLR